MRAIATHLLFVLLPVLAYTQDSFLVEDKAQVPILTPDLKDRKTVKMRLPNGLEAILISDPKTEKSGALLSVRVGSLNDPADAMGMAHFLEHMLFLGTKKYPEESGYQKFISENGGSTNAFTSHESTNYFFSVNNVAFEKALDQFGHFFIDPLFNPSGVSRELQAINQEYGMKKDNDPMRLLYVDKALANPKHPYHQFHVGHLKSLAPVSQEALKQWYAKHYSANIMRLVVYSSLPIDKLYALVAEIFQEIPNSNLAPFTTDQPTHISNGLELIVVEPIKDQRSLDISWELPISLGMNMETQPATLACQIIGDESETSILSELKAKHLAESLNCGSYRLSASNYQFMIEAKLTEEGVKQVEKVIEIIFQGIARYTKTEYPAYLFEDLRQIQLLNYQYQPREEIFDVLKSRANDIWNEPLETYPERSAMIPQFSPKDVNTLFKLLIPQTARYYLTAPEKLAGVKLTETEPWYGVRYGKTPLKLNADQLMLENDNINWPKKNPFIPTNAASLQSTANNKISLEKGNLPAVETLINNEWGTVYYARDHYFLIPQADITFEIKTPQIDIGNPFKTVLLDLYVKAISENLNSLSYTAKQAGLSFDIYRTQSGIKIDLTGWNQNIPLLFDAILAKLQTQPTEQFFNIYLDSLRMEYQNFQKKLPIQQAVEYLNSVLYKKYSMDQAKLKALGKVTYFKFLDYVQQLFNQVYVQGMIYGDFSKEQATALTEQLISKLQSTPYLKGKEQYPHLLILNEQDGPFLIEKTTTAQGGAALLVIEYPMVNFKTRAAQQILMQAMKEAFFATLRTKQQTGYLVFADNKEVEKQLLNYFGVQSTTHSPRDLLARFELFIEGYLQELPHEINEERFMLMKNALVAALEQPQKDIMEVGELLFKLGFEYNGDFNWMKKRLGGFYELTYPEFLTISKELLNRNNRRRIAVIVNGVNNEAELIEYKKLAPQSLLRKNGVFTTRQINAK